MRTETITRDLFEFDELSDSAKETARDWWREFAAHEEWWDATIDEAKAVAALMGFNIENIYFSGFSSQGDGACFIGRMAYTKGCAKAVKEYAPVDAELNRIAAAWQLLQSRHGYKITADLTKPYSGYSHENTIRFEVYKGDDFSNSDIESEVIDIGRDFMRWIYRQLESDWEYLNSDECVDDVIRVNGYEFTEEGRIA